MCSNRALFLATCAVSMLSTSLLAQTEQYDVVVYGATSSGIAAAVEAARLGRTVALVEPTDRIGGMTTNGLSFTDAGNSTAISGMAREFYTDVGAKYGSSGMELSFEPKVALGVFNDWMSTPGLTLYTNQELDLSNGVTKVGNKISSIRMESGMSFSGSMFIDAGYTGDLMAKAGVSYAVGREANSVYGEKWNGIEPNAPAASNHNFGVAVSGYKIAGDPTSGLLPGIGASGPGTTGTGDSRIQSYNYRLTVTKTANRITWTAPAGYDPNDYELVRRYVAAANITKVAGSLLKIDALRNGKYDVNNMGPVSTDYIGHNYAYPDAGYATRKQIEADHRKWEQGLLYFLANDPSMPASVRTEMSSYGLCPDEFTDNNGWSDQIYVREARRMVGRYVMTDKNVLNALDVGDSIALASYTMDSHHTQRYIDANGNVHNEGNVEAGISTPFSISYRSITPQESQASNLLVTSALSASHIAYGSIRMEPVFLETGQAGGAAAALAIANNTSVQGLDYSVLRKQLISDGLLLEWPSNRLDATGLTLSVDFNSLPAPLPKTYRYANDGTGFTTTTWDGTNTQNVVAGDLTCNKGGYNVQQSAGTSGKLQGTYNAPRQNYRSFNGSLTGDVWVSFLMNNPDAHAKAGISLNPTNNADPANGTVLNYLLVDGQTMKVSLNGQLTDNVAALATGNTHLLLMHISILASGNDQFQIWADPVALDNLGAPSLAISNIDAFGALTGLGVLSYGDASGPGGYLDAIRISNTNTAFTDVTGVAVPEPTAVVSVGTLVSLPLLVRRRK